MNDVFLMNEDKKREYTAPQQVVRVTLQGSRHKNTTEPQYSDAITAEHPLLYA